MHRTLLIASIGILSAASAFAAQNVRVGRLDNGMDVVLVENHSVPMIAANIIFKVGSRDETWNTWGSAHFLEHMLFNGTKNRTQEEIYAAFDRIGAYDNAHTGSDFTDFMVLTSRDQFATGFDVLAEMCFESTLPPNKLEKERGIVEEEIARGQTSGDDNSGGIDNLLYGSSPLSREVLGTTESIARLDRDSVLAFYHSWYAPNNALLFTTGDFDADTLFDWFQTRLKAYPPRELPRREHITAPDWDALAGMGLITRESPGHNRTITAAFEAPRPGSPDFVPMVMQLRALDKRFEASLPAGVQGSTDLTLDPDLGVIKISLTAPKDGPSSQELIALMDKELKRLIEKAPDKEEIARLARGYLSEQIYNTERLHYYGMMYASYWAVTSWDEFASWEKRLQQTTPEQLTAAAKKWLLTPKRLLVAVEPATKAAADSTGKGSVVMEKLTPEGGPEVIVRSDPTARVFAVHVLVRDRWLWDHVYGAGAVDLLHRTLGQAAESGQKTGDKLEALAATLKCADDPSIPYDDYYTSAEFSFFRLEVLPDEWQDGVNLLADLMETVPLTDDLLKSAREGSDAGASASGRSPVGAGMGRLNQVLAGGSSLAAAVYGDTKKLTIADLQKLRDGYFNPANLIITVAGPGDSGAVAQAVIKAFKDRVKTPFKRPEGWTRELRSLRSVASVRDTIALGRPQGAVVMGAALKDVPDSLRAALTVANSYFSDRMSSVLRESRGLAYSLGSSVNLQRESVGQDSNPATQVTANDRFGNLSYQGKLWGLWEISIGTRPEKLTEAESGIHELLDELKTHTFTQEEVQRLSSAITGRLLMRDMARIGQAFAMGTGEFYWGDPDSRARLIQQLNALTPEQVEAAKAWLPMDRLITVIVK
jgi:zinc protease